MKLRRKLYTSFKVGIVFVQLFNSDLAFSAASLSTDDGDRQSCVGYPENDPNPPVEVCKNRDSYIFRIIDTVTTFDRSEFELRMVKAAKLWFASHNISSDLLDQSTVQIWMSVPEASPGAAQPRAVFNTPIGQISFWFELTADYWEFNDRETAILGEGTYPSSFGHRPLKILLKSQPGASAADVIAALAEEGAANVSYDGYRWYSALTNIFAEKEVALKILKNHNKILESAQVNSVVEWIANRQMAFYFTCSPQNDIISD